MNENIKQKNTIKTDLPVIDNFATLGKSHFATLAYHAFALYQMHKETLQQDMQLASSK